MSTPDYMQYVTGFNPGATLPPAVAARQRKDKKKDEQRKVGAAVMDGRLPTQAPQPPGPASNAVPAVNALPSTAPPKANMGAYEPPVSGYQGPKPPQAQGTAQDTFPQYQAPEYHAPAKGLEYLALGLGLLFPGAPIAGAAAGFAAGLQQRSQNRYERDTQNAQSTYQSQVAAYQNQQTQREQDFLKTLGKPPEKKKDEPEDQYQAELAGYYDKATVAALQAGFPDLASKLSTIQTHAGTAGLDVAKTGETLSRVPLNQARTIYYQNVLKVSLEKAKMDVDARLRVADEQTKARIEAAGEAAASRISAAQIGATSREDVAQLQTEARLLGQYYAINAKSADQAAKLAADRVNSAERNAEQYAAAYGKATGNWNLQGGMPQVPQAGGPSITLAPSFVVGGQQPGGGMGGLVPLPGGKWGMYNPQTGQISPVSIGNTNQPPPPPKANPQAPRTGPVPPGGYDPLNPSSVWQGVPTTHSNPGASATVVQTGSANGRKVFKLSDGSVHYDSPTGPLYDGK